MTIAQTIEDIHGLFRYTRVVMYDGSMHLALRLLIVDRLSSRWQGDRWSVFEETSVRSAHSKKNLISRLHRIRKCRNAQDHGN